MFDKGVYLVSALKLRIW